MRLWIISLSAVLLAAGVGRAEGRVDFARDIKPILAEKCFACHGAWKQKGKLAAGDRPLIHKGGRDGPVIVPGKPGESLLDRPRQCGGDDTLMPPPAKVKRLNPRATRHVEEVGRTGRRRPGRTDPARPARALGVQAAGPSRRAAAGTASAIPSTPFSRPSTRSTASIPEPQAEPATLLAARSLST